jgi:hypothetical protein
LATCGLRDDERDTIQIPRKRRLTHLDIARKSFETSDAEAPRGERFGRSGDHRLLVTERRNGTHRFRDLRILVVELASSCEN